MATIDTGLLVEALMDGFIGIGKPDKQYIHRSVRRVNQILRLLDESDQGLNLEQLAVRAQLDLNTLKIYLRWMKEVELVERETEDGSLRHIYFINPQQVGS